MTAIAWNDDLLNGQPLMDNTHREFVDHLIQIEAALGQSDEVLLPRYDALLAHTEAHFAQEDRWMEALGFAPGNCHSTQHTQVLGVLREVRRLHAEAGQKQHIGALLPELMQWFTGHAQAADAGLASYMLEVGYDTVTGEMLNPPAITEGDDEGNGVACGEGHSEAANTTCGSANC